MSVSTQKPWTIHRVGLFLTKIGGTTATHEFVARHVTQSGTVIGMLYCSLFHDNVKHMRWVAPL